MDASLRTAIDEWLAIDPDPETRAELSELLARWDSGRDGSAREQIVADLSDRFSRNLEFGTAGLRGELGAGPNRMNRVVVRRAAWAVGTFLLANKSRFWASADQPLVVIGYDGRVNSGVFAADSAAILAGLGVQVRLFSEPVPTPVLAFTGRRLGSAASVMVTASHNPPRDNGYKVYLGGENGGSQLIAPDDSSIAGLIAGLPLGDIPGLKSSNVTADLGEREVEEYLRRTLGLISAVPRGRESLKICHTSLHGVGWSTVSELFARAGFSRLQPVTEQMAPDGAFPTVSFPNPEEPGAMDLAYATANSLGADLILANDPDADRLAVAVPDETQSSGWRMLSGDQVGLILGWVIASGRGHGTFANSIVSSARLGKVARQFGLDYCQTLTGFKWISKVPNLRFGYEEALGYCIDPEATPDKDGISAALLIAETCAQLKRDGRSLDDLLSEIDAAIGAEATSQISIRVTDLTVITRIMEGIRTAPPRELLGEGVVFQDLNSGGTLPPTDGVVFSAASGLRVTVRPSGTEPKLKCYLSASGIDSTSASKRMVELRAAVQELLHGFGDR